MDWFVEFMILLFREFKLVGLCEDGLILVD
jgi:hypothetical protein